MRILVELPTWLGDTIMVTPALDNLHNYYDSPKIIIAGSKISIDVLKDNVIFLDYFYIQKDYLSLIKASRQLGEFDVFFSFRDSFRSRIFNWLIRSKKKYQYKSDFSKKSHQVQKYNNFINQSLDTNFQPGKLNVKSSNQFLKNKKTKLLGINPGASYGSAKRWQSEKFAKVCIELSNKYDILIFGSNKEKKIADEIANILIQNEVTNFKNLSGKTSINELISYIKNLDLFITGDSGPMHIAGSFEVPTVSIFGPTKDSETSQWMTSKNVIIKKSVECQPCMKRECPLGHNNCMNHIGHDEVLRAIKTLY